MPDIKVIKLKVRRGLESQRTLITLDQGELGYTIDYKRLFVGDGSTAGGIVVGSKFFTPIAANKTALAAYQGDIVMENNLMYQLTGTNAAELSAWRYIGPQLDNSTITLNSSNQLSINFQSSAIVYTSGGLSSNINGLSANVDNSTIYINNTTNAITVSAINNTRIKMNTMIADGSMQITSSKLALSSLYNASRLPLSGGAGIPYGGFFNQAVSGTKLHVTTFAASTGTGSLNYTVSSAGMIIVDFGAPYGKKAIPIFDIPSEIVSIS